MKVAICEDDRIQAGQLENYLKERLKKTQTKYDIDVYFSVDDIKKIENDITKYDVYFLDIELGKDNGVELARYIRSKNKNAMIVFTTSHTGYMHEAFDVHAFNYLIKPVTKEKSDKIVTQLEEMMYENEEKLVFSYKRETISIYYDDIVYIESNARRVKIVTSDNEYCFYWTVKEIYSELPELIFGRPRSGCIVNYRYVCNIHKTEVICKRAIGEEEIHLSMGRGMYNNIISDYTRYITSERGRSRRLW